MEEAAVLLISGLVVFGTMKIRIYPCQSNPTALLTNTRFLV
jgi:hypothetical protein